MFGRMENREPEPKTLMLREYEICQNAIQNLESTIWQTGAAMTLGSIGTLALVVTKSSQVEWWVALIIGVLIFLISGVWWCMARRWWSIQQAFLIRMREIEKNLGMYRLRYLDYLDCPKNHDTDINGLPEFPKKLIQNRIKARWYFFKQEKQHRAERDWYSLPAHQSCGVQDLSWPLPVFFLTGWCLYALGLLIFR